MKQAINYLMGLGELFLGLRVFCSAVQLVIGDFSCFMPDGDSRGFLFS